jgi:amino acid transporter
MGYWRPGRGSPIVAMLVQAALTIFILGALTTEYGHHAVNDALDHVNEGVDRVNKWIDGIDFHWEIPRLEYERQWKPGSGFSTLVVRTAPVFWFFFLLTGLSLFILREQNKSLTRPFSVPYYPIVPLIFCNACAWMLYQAVDYVKWHALFAVVIVLLGIPLYWVSLLISGSRRSGPIDAEPPRAPLDPAVKRPHFPTR